uniref:Uncharacterized protein n=1 Tax=Rhizophora mucronata TaxID=61149 RepID=A0A2P2NAF4_RHIMU
MLIPRLALQHIFLIITQNIAELISLNKEEKTKNPKIFDGTISHKEVQNRKKFDLYESFRSNLTEPTTQFAIKHRPKTQKWTQTRHTLSIQ